MSDKAASMPKARIEGGVDAIVVGASADGLIAAAYLARAGLKTVLLESGTQLGLPVRVRNLAEGIDVADGEHLIFALDPTVIDDLDLFRHGIAYAPRRLETTYFFENADSLRLGGDLANAARQLGDPPAGLDKFLSESLAIGIAMRPLLAGARGASADFIKVMGASQHGSAQIAQTLMNASAEAATLNALGNNETRTAMLAEAAFRSSAMPGEPFSYSPLLARFAGEVSGLQAAMAIPDGGMLAVIDALRRAAQHAKVDIRAATPITEILIEQDRAAGVVLANGGQVRAPIVISALDVQKTFLDFIGARHLDLEFQRFVTMANPAITSAQFHAVLSGAPGDETTRENMKRRLIFAPEPHELRRAFLDAANGDVPDTLIIEAIFPNAFGEEGLAQPQLSVFAHPLPLDANPDDVRRAQIRDRIIATIEKFAPGLSAEIGFEALVLASDMARDGSERVEVFASRPGLLRQLALASGLSSCGLIGGLYFCGPQAQIGYGINGAAGRNAAMAALGKSVRVGQAP